MSFDSSFPIICSIIDSKPSSPSPSPIPPSPGKRLEKSGGPDICNNNNEEEHSSELGTSKLVLNTKHHHLQVSSGAPTSSHSQV